MGKRKRHNYQKAIEQAIDAGKVPMIPGTVAVMHTYHDDWCAFWTGGACNCSPTIELEYPPIQKNNYGHMDS